MATNDLNFKTGGAASSPFANAAAAGASTKPETETKDPSTIQENAGDKGEIYQRVNESTDTVYGQLANKHLDFSNPIMKRVAQRGKEMGASRGLTNSTIANSAAIGQVVDKAGEFATSDAQFYNTRKTENQRAATHIEGANISADAQTESARIGASAQVQSASISANAQVKAQTIAAKNRLEVQKLQDAAHMERVQVDTNSRESIAKVEVQARALEGELDRSSREYQTVIQADNQQQIEEYRQTQQNRRQQAEHQNSVWRDYNQGVVNIDANASPGSQRQQLERLNDAARLRFEAADELALAAQIGNQQNLSGVQERLGGMGFR